MSNTLGLTPLEAMALQEAVADAYGILGELDKGLGLLHLIRAEGDHAGHLGLEATVALWGVLDERSVALEGAIAILGNLSDREDAA